MASTTEQALNFVLAEVLRGKNPLWKKAINAEQTKVLKSLPGKQPDIVMSLEGNSPVIIETEFAPATTVEDDAVSRLGKRLASDNRIIENVIALRISSKLRTVEQDRIKDTIKQEKFTYCIFSKTQDGDNQRWPKRGWLKGNIDDLANCLESITLSESLISRSTDVLEEGVKQGANILEAADKEIHQGIAEHLCQSLGEQTNRMAVAIIANAAVFHTRIEGKQKIPLLKELRGSTGFVNTKVIRCWEWIIENVNYWPIFKIASDLLSNIPTVQANEILNLLYDTASELANMGATSLNDLSGRMFQKLIADRKFLATFYTLPTSATLLAELAVARLKTDWGDVDEVKTLRVGDLACGTGTLIGALYHAILSRHRRTGYDDAEIHSTMMEKSLHAFDIMPAATHLAASSLSNAHPNITFGNTRIVTMPYGYDEEGSLHIGSLDLLVEEQAESLLSLSREQIVGDQEKDGDSYLGVAHKLGISHNGLDIVIMNPPFTRSTGHEAKKIGIPVPSFAGFNTSEDEQKAMSKRLTRIRKRLLHQYAGQGNAGLGSDFTDLAHIKLKPGGVLALVLPATFAQGGKSWSRARNLLAEHYQDITLVSIASSETDNQSFSADTGIAEVLVIATKKTSTDSASTFQFVNFQRRPVHHVESVELAKSIANLDRKPGVGRILIGNEDSNGNYINTDQFLCGCAGLTRTEFAKFMLSLTDGELLAMKKNETVKIPVTTLGELGNRGVYHMDLTGNPPRPGDPPRGPFDNVSLQPGQFATYPALWGHDAEIERSFIVNEDCELLPRKDCEDKAADCWNHYASRLHLNIDFRLNSQSLAVCLTPEKTLGGTAWPNFILDNIEYEKVIVLWFNSTLGLMTYWWQGTKQQLGRTRVKITVQPSLLSVDPRQFDREKIKKAEDLFERFREVEFLPANESYRDANRRALDEVLLVELLGVSEDVVDEFDLIRLQWCAEPSVHGGKATRP